MIDDLEFHDLTYNRFSGVEKCHKEDGTKLQPWYFSIFSLVFFVCNGM